MITEAEQKENSIGIVSIDPSCHVAAAKIAHELDIPLLSSIKEAHGFYLILNANYLALQNTKEKKPTPFYIDFLSKKAQFRQENATARNELLIRAINLPRHTRIIDATAGLGRDSFILASRGYKVTMIERSPILYALLRNALERAEKDATMTDTTNRITLVHADAKEWFAQLKPEGQPEVIYLDPMFPERKKTAAVKKEMVILQTILDKDDDAPALLEMALTVAKKRVVVKRPRLANNLGDKPASYSLRGNSSRFDIYLVKDDGNSN